MYENSAMYYQNFSIGSNDLYRIMKHNLFTIASYTGEMKGNWILYTGISFNTEKISTGIGSDDMSDNNLANELKLNLSNQISDKAKIKFGVNSFSKTNNREYFSFESDSVLTWSFNSKIYAAFAETDLNPINRIALRFGLRYEHLSLNQKNYLAPRLSVAYQLFKNCQASFAYGTYTQTPGDEYLLFNKNLDPERAEHFIANIQITRSSRMFRLEVYHKNYKDLVKFDSLYAIDPKAYNNNGNGYAQGIDVFYKDSKTIRNGNLWISYALMDTRRNYQDFKYSLTPTFVSKHNLTIQYKHYIKDLDVYAGFNYSAASGRPYINPNISFEKQQFTKAYHNLSLNIFHFTELFGKFLMLHLQVSNVLGTNHIFGYRYSTRPDSNGRYQASPIQSVSKRFILFGVYMNLKGQPEL
jgi:outer membrane cobalamin receptor